MSPILFDTDVLIDHLRGEIQARDFLKKLKKKHTFVISVITVAEIEAGIYETERETVQEFLSFFEFSPITEAIAKKAGAYKRTFHRTHRLLLPDALIAATSFIMKMPLYTLNLKDYLMKDITVFSPYLK
ncbi:MAG: type II toxin-antitoxin system VapC family toxin [Proteobacteria bacterium]|nr:type II toxin-antitoxin system VapC family toxin [Pseudomonadota bacterium]